MAKAKSKKPRKSKPSLEDLLRAATKDRDSAAARRLAGALLFLADGIDRGTLKGGALKATRKRIQDGYQAAWPLVSGAKTPLEQARIVRDSLVLSAEALAAFTSPKVAKFFKLRQARVRSSLG